MMHAVNVKTDEGTAKKEYSFVNEDLRTYAMKFHTKDQVREDLDHAFLLCFLLCYCFCYVVKIGYNIQMYMSIKVIS